MIIDSCFKGKIFIHTPALKKKILLKYETSPIENEFTQTFMASFGHLPLTPVEKQKLSRSYRTELICYQSINIFELNNDAAKLCNAINKSRKNNLKIEAHDYGAYVCLAALYSGKINPKIKVEFVLAKAPLALFPSALLKIGPSRTHQVCYNLQTDFWVNHFQSLFENKQIKLMLNKAA